MFFCNLTLIAGFRILSSFGFFSIVYSILFINLPHPLFINFYNIDIQSFPSLQAGEGVRG